MCVFVARRNYYFLAVLAQEAFFIMGIVVSESCGAHTLICTGRAAQADNDSYSLPVSKRKNVWPLRRALLQKDVMHARSMCVGARTTFAHKLA